MQKIENEGWKWALVHIEVTINKKDGTGCYNDCVPDLCVRASNGTKLNSRDIPYYILTLDANGKNYSNSSTYVKNYDIAFQVPDGVSKFSLYFGDDKQKFILKK